MFPFNVGRNIPRGKAKAVVEKASAVGRGSIEEILWRDDSELLRELGVVEIGKNFNHDLPVGHQLLSRYSYSKTLP